MLRGIVGTYQSAIWMITYQAPTVYNMVVYEHVLLRPTRSCHLAFDQLATLQDQRRLGAAEAQC